MTERTILAIVAEPSVDLQQLRELKGIGPKTMPIESIYINITEVSLVRESGFPEWPWSVPRWSKRAGEKYGRGRGPHVA